VSLVVVGTAGVTVLAIAGAIRAYNSARSRRAALREPVRAVGADGVFVGAESIRLEGTSDRVCLLLHGFNDTPQSVGELARALHARGWTVWAPLLPQHGRGGDHIAKSGNAEEWIASARESWRELRARSPRAVLAGQSMGGAIAVILAQESPPVALVLLAPYLTMGRMTQALAVAWPFWSLIAPELRSDPQRSLRDPEARARSLGNGRFTPRLVYELRKIVVRARPLLRGVRGPVLVVHARVDYRIPSASATRDFDALGAAEKALVWCENSGHIVAADTGRDMVHRTVGDWLDAGVPAGGRAT
jgi:carboxylesterase